MLRLLPIIAWYLSRFVRFPLAQMPDVYEGRKNSSAIWRLSTPSQNGKLPSVLRTPGREVIPPPTREVLVEGVAEVSGDYHLRALALGRIRGPGVEEVAEFRIENPPQKL